MLAPDLAPQVRLALRSHKISQETDKLSKLACFTPPMATRDAAFLD
jgi:hypothetical protein